MKLVSFEGCVGAGKTSLASYFSRELGLPRLLEEHDKNPFLLDFYGGADVALETELSFLLIHYRQLKAASTSTAGRVAVADFSIEKDLVYARLNLTPRQLEAFQHLYDYAVSEVGLPEVVIYLDISLETLNSRIVQRGRSYELDADPSYFASYYRKVRNHFSADSPSQVHFFSVDDLALDPANEKLSRIRDVFLRAISGS